MVNSGVRYIRGEAVADYYEVNTGTCPICEAELVDNNCPTCSEQVFTVHSDDSIQS